ncbi:MAG: hypothetical protein H6Q10_1498 [Acidobacteria bacterium]|nr:hypothetical protein [Acidobacteriota bacterium]
MLNKVVVRYADGRLVKGSTGDFSPAKACFYVLPPDAPGNPIPVNLAELKAVFFVKDLVGNPRWAGRTPVEMARSAAGGRKVRVEFRDGEVLVGTTQGYQRDRVGFFVVPVDPGSNNERCFVLNAAVSSVTFLSGAVPIA